MSALRSQDTSGKRLSKCIDCIISMLAGITTLLTHMSTLFFSLNHVLKEMYHQGMWLFLFETQTNQYLNCCILTVSSPMKVFTSKSTLNFGLQ